MYRCAAGRCVVVILIIDIVVVVVVSSQMLIAYACITRVCIHARADDIPVIRVANYICRCVAREGGLPTRRVDERGDHGVCVSPCVRLRTRADFRAPIRRIRCAYTHNTRACIHAYMHAYICKRAYTRHTSRYICREVCIPITCRLATGLGNTYCVYPCVCVCVHARVITRV